MTSVVTQIPKTPAAFVDVFNGLMTDCNVAPMPGGFSRDSTFFWTDASAAQTRLPPLVSFQVVGTEMNYYRTQTLGKITNPKWGPGIYDLGADEHGEVSNVQGGIGAAVHFLNGEERDEKLTEEASTAIEAASGLRIRGEVGDAEEAAKLNIYGAAILVSRGDYSGISRAESLLHQAAIDFGGYNTSAAICEELAATVLEWFSGIIGKDWPQRDELLGRARGYRQSAAEYWYNSIKTDDNPDVFRHRFGRALWNAWQSPGHMLMSDILEKSALDFAGIESLRRTPAESMEDSFRIAWVALHKGDADKVDALTWSKLARHMGHVHDTIAEMTTVEARSLGWYTHDSMAERTTIDGDQWKMAALLAASTQADTLARVAARFATEKMGTQR